MTSVKFFYIEDDTGALLGANGTALTAALAAVGGVLSDKSLDLPTFPLWTYFFGLIFAFIAKAVIDVFNSDLRAREQNQAHREFLIDASANNVLSEDAKE